MKVRNTIILFALASLSLGFLGCKSWSPVKEEGKCSQDRQWVPAQKDPKTGEWKDGYCEWLPGKKP